MVRCNIVHPLICSDSVYQVSVLRGVDGSSCMLLSEFHHGIARQKKTKFGVYKEQQWKDQGVWNETQLIVE